jgi:osmoprotectant transport system ATP-binding protein
VTPVVEFREVSFRAGGREILRQVSFAINEGETLALLGRSGSGKTTALRMINALLTPTAGEVRVEGRPTTAWPPRELRRRIGYVIQETGLFPHFTVRANVGLVPRLAGWDPARIEARSRELLQALELPPDDFLDRYPAQLSGGQQQRVGVARALAADPGLLLFDEPFGKLDPVTRAEVQRQFLRVTRALGKTALFVTHDLREALLVADRIGLMHQGVLEWLGPAQAFLVAENAEARRFRQSLEPADA